ncbi:MAG TPA: aspartate kinase, partial [Bacillota bacterium]|nr:aspartate kinase [Bacillota bacterium]
MKVIVQKFGGTSVATQEGRENVVLKVKEALGKGLGVVVVVSAMGRNGDPYATDTLIGLARGVLKYIKPRELDLLMSCGEN